MCMYVYTAHRKSNASQRAQGRKKIGLFPAKSKDMQNASS